MLVSGDSPEVNQMWEIVMKEARMKIMMRMTTRYLRQMRKMVMQEARMTRQSTATITDIRWRCGSPTEVDSCKQI